ncbi:MAG: pseudaminic acid synthase [Sporolactobacillus sp.]
MTIQIANHRIDQASPTFIVAELSANHGKSMTIAKETIKAAKEAGADAIKLQTYTADTMTIDCRNDYFKIKSGTVWDGKYLYDLYKEASMPWEWHQELMAYAQKLNLICFSSPFDKTAVDLLESLDVPAYKVASFEIVDLPLIEYMARKGKPMIISTGVATLGEIDDAVHACRKVGNDQIILLKCTSAYPAKIEEANLLTMKNLGETFHVEIGLSDHTLGTTVPIASVALGAKVIEKHFILDKSIGGADASFSLDKNDFKLLVDSVRDAESALGTVNYEISAQKKKSRALSRSLFVVRDIKAGELFTDDNIRSIRPGQGLPPKYIQMVIGKKARINLLKGTPISWEVIE